MGCRCMNSPGAAFRTWTLGLRGYSLYEMRWLGTFWSLDLWILPVRPGYKRVRTDCPGSSAMYLGSHVPLYLRTEPPPLGAPWGMGNWARDVTRRIAVKVRSTRVMYFDTCRLLSIFLALLW